MPTSKKTSSKKSSSTNSGGNSYDPSRLISAPKASVKTEPGTSSSGSASFKPNVSGSRKLGSFRPSVGSKKQGTRRFAPKVASSSTKRRQANKDRISDAEAQDLMDASLFDDGSERKKDFTQHKKPRVGSRMHDRRQKDSLVHVAPKYDRKPTQAVDPDVMQVDSSSDEDTKVFEKTPAQLHAEYFDGIANPPLKVDDGELEGKKEVTDLRSTFKEDELLFIQLPSHLPHSGGAKKSNKNVQRKQQSVDDEYENIWNQEFDNSLTQLPEGLIGTLKVYKSGKTKLELKTKGEQSVLLDVSPAQEHGFCEDIAAIDTEKKRCFMFGSVTKRVSCIPDCESLLREGQSDE